MAPPTPSTVQMPGRKAPIARSAVGVDEKDSDGDNSADNDEKDEIEDQGDEKEDDEKGFTCF